MTPIPDTPLTKLEMMAVGMWAVSILAVMSIAFALMKIAIAVDRLATVIRFR